MYRIVIVYCFIFCVMGFAQNRTQPATQAQELGKVSWYRDFDQAIALSQKQNKPIFVLFQEVPGCLTCRNYGKGVLSSPVIIKTIETHFIPLAIFNNKPGKDNAILKRYGEPSWNNPVVRIVDAKGENLIWRICRRLFKIPGSTRNVRGFRKATKSSLFRLAKSRKRLALLSFPFSFDLLQLFLNSFQFFF
ncbi:MAG: thioredoxin family protein [Flavobacteriaceae bacterium]|nr:thioredoxin family protein [Flavobacteriaceae bacterium]